MIDTYGFKNINFSCGDDCEEFKKQRMTRGFDDSELWSLDITISKFILPRLIAFKKEHSGYPAKLNSGKEWNNVLDAMIKAFEWHANDSHLDAVIPSYVTQGMNLFTKYFTNLWD